MGMDFSKCWAERHRIAKKEEQAAAEYQQELVALFGVLSEKITARIRFAAKARYDRREVRAEMRELVAMACYKPLWDILDFRIAIWNIVDAQIAECYRTLVPKYDDDNYWRAYWGAVIPPDGPKKSTRRWRPTVKPVQKRLCREMTKALNRAHRRAVSEKELRRGLWAAIREEEKEKKVSRETIL